MQAAGICYSYSFIQLIQGNLVHGLPNVDPFARLTIYMEIRNAIKIARLPNDMIRLDLFSFSLVNDAKKWLDSFKGHSLRDWDEVLDKFFSKYFPKIKNKIKISSFHQFPNESLSEV